MGKHRFDKGDKRQIDRSQLFYYVKVVYRASQKPAGYLADISTQGLMLFSKEEIPENEVFELQINMEEELELNRSLIFEAKSIWCRPDANPEFYITGFEFTSLGAGELDTIKYVIHKFGFDK